MNFGATILDADGVRLTSEERAFFRDADPFGFILFDRNLDSPEQIRALTAEMREAVGREAPILIDQEGGRVQRLRPPLARDWPAPLDHVAAAGPQAERAMYLRYRLIADELRSLGIDCDCAPMVDLARADTHAFLKNRCYGTDPDTVARLGRAVARGLLDGGVLPVLKHIPGHGAATQDSHVELPRVSLAAETLDAQDFAPFRALADLPLGMTAHIVYDALDAEPATLSPKVMEMIRQDIGFSGLVMTDDIGMKALSGSLPSIVTRALGAGCDVILHCNGSLPDRQSVAEAAGRMSDAAQARAEAALAARYAPDAFEAAAAEAELASLTEGALHV